MQEFGILETCIGFNIDTKNQYDAMTCVRKI
jgi:hypothetical protein